MSSTLTVTNLTATNLTDGAGTTSTFANINEGHAKALCNLNFATASITTSTNISSITDNGTGDFSVTFTNAMANINYGVTGSNIGDTQSLYICNMSSNQTANTTTTYQQEYRNTVTDAAVDVTVAVNAVHGDLA